MTGPPTNTDTWREGYVDGRRTIFSDNETTARRRLEAMGILALPRGARILDLGSGDGAALRVMRDLGFGQIIGMEPDLALAKNGPAIGGAAPGLPFRDESFDAVFAIEVLHHLPDEAALQTLAVELMRVLRADGVFACIEPAQTLLRRALTPLLLSPLGLVTGFSRRKRQMVLAERELLDRWLALERRFPRTILAPAGLRVGGTVRRGLTTLITASRPPRR